jgi:putative ABC transport system permease protein
MKTLRTWFLRVRGLFRKKQLDRELAAELESHLQMHIEDNLRAGMSPKEARRQALMKLGGVEQTKESYRDRHGLPILETLFQDLRFASRMLAKNPGFAAVAVLTLALGIGANTAVFSMVNALLLHPYTFRDLDRIMLVWQDKGWDASFDARFIAPGDASELATNTKLFDLLATYRCHTFGLESGSETLPVEGCGVSANFFELLGVAPLAGRTFAASEQQPGLDAVAVVSHAFWQRQLGGDRGAIGKSIRLNGRTFTVIGIMPLEFKFPVGMQLWVPLALTPAEQADRSQLSLQAIARFKQNVDVGQARATLTGFSARLAKEYPKTNTGRRTTLLPLRRELYLYTLPLFSLLQIAAGFVLLLACANLANLLFARMIGRQKEIALRTALGAGPRRLAQLFLSETLLFSVIAGAGAMAISLWTVKLLRNSISPDWTQWVPGWSRIQVDPVVLGFTILLGAAVGVLFGLAALAHAGRVDPNAALKEGGPGSMTRGRAKLRAALVVAQLVFALVLLVCAGLTIQGFMRLANVYAGLRPESVMDFTPVLPLNSYTAPAKISALYQQLLRDTAALPGVTAAALVANPPASNTDNATTSFAIEGRPEARPGEAPSAALQIASGDYFRALQILVFSGRVFCDADTASSTPVALISRSMAAKFWPHGDALGQHIRLIDSGEAPPWLTIVGVVDDVRQNWWNSPSQLTIYRPVFQSPERGMSLMLRVSGSPGEYAAPVRAIIRQLDPAIAVYEVHTLKREITDAIGIIRIMGTLMGVFGAIALALSAVGVYGVLSESVAQRTREIGIRVALGAAPSAVWKLVLGYSLKLTGIGLAIAVPVALAINRTMATLVLGIVSMDFAVIAMFTAILALVAVAASYFPARRAMRVDPMVALRYE